MPVQVIRRPDLGKKPYGLKCRFRIEPRPSKDRLDRLKVVAAEMFQRDMHVQGWEFAPRFGWRLRGPFTPVQPVTLPRVPRELTAREMLPLLMRGERFPAPDYTAPQIVAPLEQNEYWEYEVHGVFIRNTILTEIEVNHDDGLS